MINHKLSGVAITKFVQLQKVKNIMTSLQYSTVKQLCSKHPVFNQGGIRALIFNEEKNGLKKSGAVVRIGRKILINDAKFFAWIEAQNEGGKS